jgi:hypothetical protein
MKAPQAHDDPGPQFERCSEMLARAEMNQKSSVARRCRRRGKEAKIERANTNTANIIGGALRR